MTIRGRPPIPLDKDNIISLYQSGMSSFKIGHLFGVSCPTIIRRLHKWGISIRYTHPSWNKGLTTKTDNRVKQYSEKSSRMSGHKHTNETKIQMSLSRKGKNIWSKGSIKSEITKQRNSKASKKMWQDPKYQIKQSERMRKVWADPQYSSRVRPLIIKGNYTKPTQPEQRLINIINKYELPFKYTGDGSFQIHGINPDFVNYNGEKVVIEVFGDYWHGKAARTWKETELGRIMTFNSFGFRCIILWEKELNTLSDKAIAGRIENETRRIPSLHI